MSAMNIHVQYFDSNMRTFGPYTETEGQRLLKELLLKMAVGRGVVHMTPFVVVNAHHVREVTSTLPIEMPSKPDKPFKPCPKPLVEPPVEPPEDEEEEDKKKEEECVEEI